MTDAATRYVGIVVMRGEPTALCITRDTDGVTLDLPGHMRFRLALDSTAENRYRVPPGAGPAVLELDFSTTSVTGPAYEGSVEGPVTLWPEVSIDPATFAPRTGAYRTADGRDFFLGTRGGGGAPIPFLLDGDEVVRLHATSDGLFVSERGEIVRFESDALVFGRAGGETTTASRFEPYASREVTFNAADGVQLAGTLFSPHGDGPFPAVVLVHGSNAGERGWYQLYAHHFARRGIAALAYDRRGSGQSGGSTESTLELRARDAAAAIEFVRGQEGVDPGRVGLWAFSNGTWSAPMVAAHMTPVAFMVVTGAAGVSGAESEIHRKLVELRSWGIATETLDDVQRAWRTAYACIAGGHWPADVSGHDYDALIARLHNDAALSAISLAGYAVVNPWLAPIPPTTAASELQRFAGRVADLAYDPIEDYTLVSCPVLFLVGEDDPNTPAAAARRVRDAFARAGNLRSKVEVVPGAGHYINITPPKLEGMARAEAASELHGFRFAPGYLEGMTAWMLGAARG